MKQFPKKNTNEKISFPYTISYPNGWIATIYEIGESGYAAEIQTPEDTIRLNPEDSIDRMKLSIEEYIKNPPKNGSLFIEREIQGYRGQHRGFSFKLMEIAEDTYVIHIPNFKDIEKWKENVYTSIEYNEKQTFEEIEFQAKDIIDYYFEEIRKNNHQK